jgi:hypothetical protein
MVLDKKIDYFFIKTKTEKILFEKLGQLKTWVQLKV